MQSTNSVSRLVFLLGSLCGVTLSAQAPIPLGDVTVELQPVATGLSDVLTGNTQNVRRQVIPIDMTPLGDGRHLIFTLTGHVRLLRADGTLAPGAYLDTRDPSRAPADFNFIELGNTSIAAHPGFSDSSSRGFGKFYTLNAELVQHQLPSDFDDGVTSAIDCVLYEWSMINPQQNILGEVFGFLGASPTMVRRELMRSRRPGIIHTLADMAFSPDEYLLITSGDGGGNAVPPGSTQSQSRTQNALNPRSIFGSLLRIDPLDLPTGETRPLSANGQYRIHPDNFGFTDSDALTPGETLAYGLRSPYRMNVDSANGDIYFGDVGESRREEINRVAFDASGVPIENGRSGLNFGWGRFEGTRFNSSANNNVANRAFTSPLFELYQSLGGQSEATTVVGGFVYRGSAFPELVGRYVFADTGENEMQEPSNVLNLYHGDPDGAGTSSSRDGFVRMSFQTPVGVPLPDRIWSLAEDENGELYALVGPRRGLDFSPGGPFNDDPNGTDGGIYKIVPTCPSGVGGSACATVDSLGGGCLNSAGLIATIGSPANALPVLGNSWTLGVEQGPAGNSAFLGIGLFDVGGIDLGSIGMPNCGLHSDLSLTVAVVLDGAGAASTALPISATLPLGFPVFVQGVILDPGVNALGVVLSDAAEARLGLR